MNMTSDGPCSRWSGMHKFIGLMNLYEYVGLDDDNYCRNTFVLEVTDRPWCYSRGKKIMCDVPKCKGNRLIVFVWIPLNVGRLTPPEKETARIGVRGFTCS